MGCWRGLGFGCMGCRHAFGFGGRPTSEDVGYSRRVAAATGLGVRCWFAGRLGSGESDFGFGGVGGAWG